MQAATKAIVSSQVELLNAFGEFPSNTEVLIAPSALHVSLAQSKLRGDVHVASQDLHTAKGLGAYTGAHTVDQLVDAGVKWTLTGHSERRSIFGETDGQTAAKTKIALDGGLSVVLCIGETLPEREAGETLNVVVRQLQAVVDVLPVEAWARVVVAYEPVWAIGTGKVCGQRLGILPCSFYSHSDFAPYPLVTSPSLSSYPPLYLTGCHPRASPGSACCPPLVVRQDYQR
jgi:triosephosphate isomerase (TIM)